MRNQHKNQFLEALSRDWSAMDTRTFADTVDALTYDPLIAKEWTEHHTIPLLEAVESSGRDVLVLARTLHNPSSIRCLLYFDLLMAKVANAGVAAYGEIFDFYRSLLTAWCVDDPFAHSFRNRIHQPYEVSELQGRGAIADPGIARALGRLSSACYHLSHGLYSDMNPQLVYDNFGPYHLDGGGMFSLREFGNLRPVDLWPETARLGVDRIRIGARYEDVDLTVDATTHAVYRGDVIGGLRAWWCEADGSILSLEEIERLRGAIEACAIEVYTKVKQQSFEEKKKMYVFQKSWSYHALFGTIGLDWRPHEEILNAIQDKPLFDGWREPVDRSDLTEMFQKIFDPDANLPPEVFRQQKA